MKKRPAAVVPHFIKEERKKGSTDQEIQHKLLDAGWHMDIIHQALDPKPQSPEKKKTHKKTTPKDKYLNTPLVAGAAIMILLLLALFI